MRKAPGRRVSAFALAAAFGAAACGSDSTAPGTAELSPSASMEIAVELLGAVMEIGFDALGAPGAGEAFLAGTPPEIPGASFNTETITETVPCEHGGSIAVTGTFTDEISEEGTGSFSFELRQNPQGCGIHTSEGFFTVNGNPELVVGGDMTVSEWEPGTMTMSFSGGYSWAGDPGSGSCGMNVIFVMDFADPDGFTMNGSICGHSV
jgi:hypothetical protein